MKDRTRKIISGLCVEIMLTADNGMGIWRRSRSEYRVSLMFCRCVHSKKKKSSKVKGMAE